MKKTIKILTLVFVFVLFCLAMTSCGHEHFYGEWVTVKAPTCTETGVQERTCECGQKESGVLSALGHKAGADATCTENCVCTVCGEVLQSEKGHIPGAEATCTTSQNCTVCNAELKAALGHTYKTSVTSPTCTNQGHITHTCACGDSYKDNYTAALGHTPNEKWEIVTEATESANGLKIQKCSVCGEKVVEAIIPATASLGLEFTSKGDGTCYVSGSGTCTDTDIVIPSTYNGMRVTSIGDYAFYYCTGLTSVTIPDSVTSIGNWAFNCCTGLTSVTIGNGVTSIGNGAFYTCTGLTSITIPDSVTSIGNRAFSNCNGLTSVTIPDSVTSIGDKAFASCDGLTSITIGNGVTSIGEDAFSSCSGLTSIEIPDSVTSIGDRAFYGCSGLTSVTIPDSVTSIGSNAFAYCTGLTSITVDSDHPNYASIDGVLFNKAITELICYPAGKTGAYTIPDSVTSIGNGAFYECDGLTSITIPDSVTSIGSNAFAYCTGLTSITVDSDHPNYASIDGVLFDKAITKLICYPAGKTGTSYTIPDSVTSIGSNAFRDCTGLTSVTIGNGVTSIGYEAFYGCDGLTSITFNGTTAQWNAISKDSDWKGYIPATEVVCSDGEVLI